MNISLLGKRLWAILISVVATISLGITSNAFADPPTNSGVVTRGDFAFATFDVDASAGISSILGADPVEFCSGPFDFDFITFADKIVQNGLRLNTIGRGHVTASVWPFTVFDCDLFLTIPPLATGTAKVVNNDNDLFGNAFCDEKNNINSFGWQGHGTLYSPAGEKRQFSMFFHALFDCDDGSFDAKTKIKLTG